MKKHPYRALLIWVVLVLGLVNIYPTIGWMSLSEEARAARIAQWQTEDQDWLRQRHTYFQKLGHDIKRWAQFNNDLIINLGLDLKGGVHMVLGFDINDLPREEYQAYIDQGYSEDQIISEVQESLHQPVERRVQAFEASEPIIQTLGTNQIQVQLPGEKDVQRAIDLIKKAAVLNFHIVAGADETIQVLEKIKAAHQEAFLNLVKAPTLRGEPFNVSVSDIDRATAFFQDMEKEGLVPADKTIRFSTAPRPYEKQQYYEIYVLDKTPIQEGEGLTSASALPDNTNPGSWQILFQFNAAAGAHFGEVTEENVNRQMAIVIDEQVISAPVIRDRITTSGQITGSFTPEEARDLAIALNSGSMKVPVREEFTAVVDASLGAEAVRQGVTASLLGLLLVAAFMVVYYHVSGLIAVVALIANAMLLLAAMAYFNLTLTLPGIAGLILTMGMAVDANVLIFERIREELKLGHSLAASIENGFNRAAITIVDANVTTLIAGLVLMQFGTGPVEGFAVVLNIGVITSVFAALVISRAMFDFFYGRGITKKLTMLSAFKMDATFPFMKYRVPCAVLSVTAIVIGMVIFGMRGERNLGVDFREGTNVRLTLDADNDVPVDDVRRTLEAAGFKSAIVQQIATEAGHRNQFLVRVGKTSATSEPVVADTAPSGAWEGELQYVAQADPAAAPVEEAPADTAAPAEEAPAPAEAAAPAEEAPAPAEAAAPAEEAPAEAAAATPEAAAQPETHLETVAMEIQEALVPLTKAGSIAGVRLDSVLTVGPAVGQRLRYDALQAVLLSFVFIILYLWFRFELRFALGAILALFHDVLITLGLFALFQREINMAVIAAILTIIGYSLNDTIVVFDRIREDMQLYRGKGLKLLDIMDLSINQTLSRTVLTALTTLFVVIVLFIFGGGDLNDFAFALMVGIVVGTYSSIFIASPAVYVWQKLRGRTELPTDSGNRGNREGKGGTKPRKNRQATA
ncbi:MAG: protein translocase subunit SecD [Candidatus Hydrogenedentes bacterium]|nr:protein translocase subunit SecD [Candidatus Hydrogenedentota bacterium]